MKASLLFSAAADYGSARRFETADRQRQTLFAVADYGGEPVDIELGIGHGFAAASSSSSS